MIVPNENHQALFVLLFENKRKDSHAVKKPWYISKTIIAKIAWPMSEVYNKDIGTI